LISALQIIRLFVAKEYADNDVLPGQRGLSELGYRGPSPSVNWRQQSLWSDRRDALIVG